MRQTLLACPRCRAPQVEIIQAYTAPLELISDEGRLTYVGGGPDRLRGECRQEHCGHSWKLRGVHRVEELPGAAAAVPWARKRSAVGGDPLPLFCPHCGQPMPLTCRTCRGSRVEVTQACPAPLRLWWDGERFNHISGGPERPSMHCLAEGCGDRWVAPGLARVEELPGAAEVLPRALVGDLGVPMMDDGDLSSRLMGRALALGPTSLEGLTRAVGLDLRSLPRVAAILADWALMGCASKDRRGRWTVESFQAMMARPIPIRRPLSPPERQPPADVGDQLPLFA